jgi:hypothetical protein
MRPARSLLLLVLVCFLAPLWRPSNSSAASDDNSLAGDALFPPSRPTLATSDTPLPTLYQPSAFLAGRVAVQIIFVESNGVLEPSTEDWSPALTTVLEDQIAAALEWWGERMPNARLDFDLTSQVVASDYEPILHKIGDEGLWIGDALGRLGHTQGDYFDQVYAADESLRRARGADWATTIFVANSAADPDGRFASGHFAYAYVGGPFLVLTSDAGSYGTSQMAPVAAHELGHIFGALDQYAAAGVPCTQRSGYLAVPTTNSQADNCGTRFICIMLDPLAAYTPGLVDVSALGQVGYRDEDGDTIPDPIDTTPTLTLTLSQPTGGGRPTVSGRAADQPYPLAGDYAVTINTIARVEYRIDGGAWIALAAQDGVYDNQVEELATQLPLYDGEHSVELRAVNSVGAFSPVLRRSVTVQGVGPRPAYEVELPKFSNTDVITLNLSAPAGAAVQISEDPFFSGAEWRPAQPAIRWRFGPGDGARPLFVRFRDDAALESPPFGGEVVLDREPPTGQAQLRAGQVPLLVLQAQDTTSGVAELQLIFGDGTAGGWQPFQSSVVLPTGTSSVQVRVRDAAGNSSPLLNAVSRYELYLPLIN